MSLKEWKLVPLEPTDEMIVAALMAWGHFPHISVVSIYKVMVEAVPSEVTIATTIRATAKESH